VQGLAAQSGGMLDIHSEPDAGTTIDLWLPQATTSAVSVTRAAPAAQPAHQLPQTEPCKVLVVDDDLLVMTGTAAMIDDLGHTSIEAHSAAEALAKLASGIEIDVVITDHAMPSMTGLQLAECIRDRFPGLPIILATGYAELPVDPAKLGLLKLTKPCTQQEIATAIHLALRSRGTVRPFPAPAAARG
jgi:CheY-like chemotaxis protein